MQFSMATLLAVLGMVASVSATCRATGPGLEIGPSQDCPKNLPAKCKPRTEIGEIWGPCCTNADCK